MAATETRSKRATAYRVLSILFFVAAAAMLWGVLSLLLGWFDNEDGGIHKVHTLGWGVLAGLLLTGGLGAGVWRAERHIAGLQQAFAALLGLEIAGIVTQRWGLTGFGAVIILPVLLILLALHPARAEFFTSTTTISWPLAICTAAAAVPLFVYASRAITLQRNGISTDPHVSNDHWTTMAGMAFALVLCGVLASARTRGWPFVAWCAGLGGALIGLASVTFPDHAGSFGTFWGSIAIAGGILFVGEAELERRRESQDVGEYAGRRRHMRAA